MDSFIVPRQIHSSGKKKFGTNLFRKIASMKYYYILLLPVLAYFVIFQYIPMYGITIAFKNYRFADGIFGSSWVGIENFIRLFNSDIFYRVLKNTVNINVLRLIIGFPSPIILAILINEIINTKFKKVVQSVSYLPYFISWVILGGIVMEVLSPARGIVNQIIMLFGKEPIYFLADTKYFVGTLIVTGIWQNVGWGSVVYLAAITSIDSEQYESAFMDGANRFQRIIHITFPSIIPIISIMFILSLGDLLNNGFDQVFNLYNPMVYSVGDIIDTYVYRNGIINVDYSFSTAVGLFKNVIGFLLVVLVNTIVSKFSDNGIW